MRYNPEVMFAVFRKFLEKRPEHLKSGSSTEIYFNEYIEDLPFTSDIVRWHIAVLFDEFLFKGNILAGVYGDWRLENPYDHLNKSGQELYESLKQKYD